MPKKLFFLVFMAFAFFLPSLVKANVIISKVQISPTEDRFIKLFNQGDSSIDLTGWYIQRKTQTGSTFGSLVSKTYFENKKINAGGYFLISRAPLSGSDVVVDNMTLTESNVIQIKNSNGEIVDKVCWGDVSDCGNSSMPNPVSGESIQFANYIENPVLDSSDSASSDGLPASNTYSDSSLISSSIKDNTIEVPEIKTKIIASKNVSFADAPIILNAKAYGYQNEPLMYGKYFWNFGDGDSKEILGANSQQFSHTYFYPGDYLLSVYYYSNPYLSVIDASDQIIIKVIPADISISNTGDAQDFFIELSNNTDHSADISSWVLSSDQRNFILPLNTFLTSKKTMIISARVTGFTITDKNSLKLKTPEGNTVFNYVPDIIIPTPITPKNITTSTISEYVSDMGTTPIFSEENLQNPDSNGVNLSIYQYSIFIVAVVFIGISAYVVYFVRRKKVALQAGDDFEIIDE